MTREEFKELFGFDDLDEQMMEADLKNEMENMSYLEIAKSHILTMNLIINSL